MVLNQHSCVVPVGEDFFEFEVNSASLKLSFFHSPLPELSSYRSQNTIPTPADEVYKRNLVRDNQYKYQLPLSNDLKFYDCDIDYEVKDFIVFDDWLLESLSTNAKRPFSGQKLKASGRYLKSLFRKKLKFSLLTSPKPVSHTKLIKVRKSKETHNTSKSCNAAKCPIRSSKPGKVKGKEICRDSLSDSWIRSLSESITWLSKTKNSSVSPAYFLSSQITDDINCPTSRTQFIQEPEKSVLEAIRHCKMSQMLQPL